jgi:hypothetical protein
MPSDQTTTLLHHADYKTTKNRKLVWKNFTPERWQLVTECKGVQSDKLEISMTFFSKAILVK